MNTYIPSTPPWFLVPVRGFIPSLPCLNWDYSIIDVIPATMLSSNGRPNPISLYNYIYDSHDTSTNIIWNLPQQKCLKAFAWKHFGEADEPLPRPASQGHFC